MHRVQGFGKCGCPMAEISYSPDLQIKENSIFCTRKKRETMQKNNRHSVIHVFPMAADTPPDQSGRGTWVRMVNQFLKEIKNAGSGDTEFCIKSIKSKEPLYKGERI
jgi:hypothetical protein